jgi:hypothetical protein
MILQSQCALHPERQATSPDHKKENHHETLYFAFY